MTLNDENKILAPKQNIVIENVTFKYDSKDELVLDNLSINIPAKSVVGIVGPSGSGKSTIIDILLGLIKPNKGRLLIDNEVVNIQNVRQWQNNIGFVAQSIFLSDSSIAENIAFGIPKIKSM